MLSLYVRADIANPVVREANTPHAAANNVIAQNNNDNPAVRPEALQPREDPPVEAIRAPPAMEAAARIVAPIHNRPDVSVGESATAPGETSQPPLEHNGGDYPRDSEKSRKFSVGFYIVVSNEPQLVHNAPIHSSPSNRSISQGATIFVTARILGGDGVHWLRIVDGWIQEEKVYITATARSVVKLILPLGRDIGAADHPSPSSVDTKRREIEKRGETDGAKEKINITSNDHITSKQDVMLTTGSSETHSLERASTVGEFREGRRTTEIIELQKQMSNIARNIEQLNASMLMCQQTLSRLVQGTPCLSSVLKILLTCLLSSFLDRNNGRSRTS